MKKVAVIGLGSIANRHRRNLKELFPNSILYAMSASGRLPENKVSDCDGIITTLDELIQKQPDMVIVASPAPFHAKHAIPLMQAGIPTLIEKPVTTTTDDVVTLIDSEKKTNTPVAVGYCLRYLPSSIKMQALLKDGIIGDVYNSTIEIGQYLPDWRPNINYRDSVSANKHLGGGALLELSHELDYVQWLFGKLTVESAILRSSNSLGLDVEDLVDLTLINDDGLVCNVHLDFVQRAVKRTCSVVGSKGRLDWNLIENWILLSNENGTEMLYSEPTWDKNKMYLSMVLDFVNKIDKKSNNCVDLLTATKTIKLIECIRNHSGVI